MDRKRKKRSWRRVTNALSCLIVFCTTYALILPALTLETEAQQFYCDKEEHTHTEDCYHSKDPLCGKEEGESIEGHVHDDSCYEIKQTLICPLEESEEHVHDESCFQQEQVLICDKEESESVEGHEHSPKCYLSVDPVCGKEEHTHSKECTSNKELKEKKEDWENSIPETLSDKLDEKIVQIAKSQKDYKEVKENFELDQDGKEHYYTRYGEWYGKPYEDWNIMFASFVLHYAGIKNEQIPYGHDWNEWIEDLSKKELFEPEGYEPQNGDLIFFKDQKDENVPDKEIKSYVGFLVDQDKNKVIVGDLNDQVKEIVLQEKEYETMAYVHPEQEVQEVEDEKQPTEQDPVEEGKEEKEELTEEGKEDKNEETKEEIEYRLPEEFKVETEDFTLTLKPRSIPGEQEEEQKEENKQPEEESKEQEETEKTTDNELQIKKFSLEPEENIQDKIDEEINRSEDELEQIQEEAKQEQEEEENKPIPTLQIEKIDETTQNEEDQLEIQKLKEQSEKDTDPEQLLDLSFYKLRFFVEDQEINLEDQKFDAELTPTQAFVEKYDTTKDLEDVAPEAEIGFSMYLKKLNSENALDLDHESQEGGTYSVRKEIAPILYTQNSDELLTFSMTKTSNPSFNVQTYGYIKQRVAVDQNSTSDKVTTIYYGDQGIPSKFDLGGSNLTRKYYEMESIGDKHQLKKDYKKDNSGNKVPIPIYNQKNYEYHKAPNLQYFNILRDNQSYELKEIWVLKKETTNQTDMDSTNRNDWNVYSVDRLNENTFKDVHFTNNEEYKPENPNPNTVYIPIKSNTVIRLVYSEKVFQNKSDQVKLYDYDITDGNYNNTMQTNADNPSRDYTTFKDGKAQGINSGVTETMNNAILFGNGNGNAGYGKGHDGKVLNDQVINGANALKTDIQASFQMKNVPTLGLLSSFSKESNGEYHLTYNSAVNGKQVFKSNTSGVKSTGIGTLTFDRLGDTYSANSISGENLQPSTLNKFVRRNAYGTTIPFWQNDFWPFDTQDIKGQTGMIGGKATHNKNKVNNGTFPKADNDKNHNNFFGMTYEVEFETHEDYIGPLNYFFIGDDDMWVFVDGVLVCDLGGIHQSIGAETDIREAYKKKEGKDLPAGKHTMNIFYLERGQSGSTCYFEYSLPSVSQDEITQNVGHLSLKKYTSDSDENEEFSFNIQLFDAQGNMLPDDYAYSKFDKDNNEIGRDIILKNGETIITLKKNQTAVINYLPNGTTYKITEIVDLSKQLDCEVEAGSENSINPITGVIDGNNKKFEIGTSSGLPNISNGNTVEIVFQNNRKYQLPETGGIGIEPPIMASGISLIATSGYVVILRKKGWWSKKKK